MHSTLVDKIMDRSTLLLSIDSSIMHPAMNRKKMESNMACMNGDTLLEDCVGQHAEHSSRVYATAQQAGIIHE